MQAEQCAMQCDDIIGAVGLFADDGFVYASQRTKIAVMKLARDRFGQWAVNRYKALKGSEEGYASLPAMIADDAKKFGMWCLDVQGASRRNTPGAWAEGRIQRVAIDGLADGELVAIVEGYGDNLSDALGSALHVNGHSTVEEVDDEFGALIARTRIPHVNTATGANSLNSKNKFKCIVRSRGHQICRMAFASHASALRATVSARAHNSSVQHNPHHYVWINGVLTQLDGPAPRTPLPDCYEHSGWDTSNVLAFQWPGYGISAPFLRKDPGQTWDAAFRGPGPLPEGASRRRFVPRPLRFPKEERTPRADWVGD